MTGEHTIDIKCRKAHYNITVKNKVTILRGHDPVGDYTVYNLVNLYDIYRDDSGIQLQCDKECIYLSTEFWEETLNRKKDCIVFIDTFHNCLYEEEKLAEIINNTDNYYIIITDYKLDKLLSLCNK